MKAHKSAHKHGISEAAGIYAAEHHVYVADLDDDNPPANSGWASTRTDACWN